MSTAPAETPQAAEPVEEPTSATPAAGADSMPSALDKLRAEYAKPVEAKSLFKRLLSRGERLVAEYKPLKLDDAKAAIEKESDPSMLISSLKAIWIHDPEHAEASDRGLVKLGAWSGQPQLDPLGFDKRLTDLLGIPFGSSGAILLSLFEGNDLAIGAQAAELGEWSVKTKRTDLQDFRQG
ncbi:MAG TPA: hypothetical protein VK756_07800 [Solirubrobacteraceae bacterium]|jgi:hypothetical protein|nr:hypothetical protein [Solirubrobacteraceae bacterium]